ncbi:M20/M25/M40 family metallo-hydrolase [Balneola sp. MJW-20]|uniref:M20/M25/M40 family metallo-hydrolase n=1 Tax=Gracilimonas aurantiaca TaxID=3234185 RepID=UPI003466754A
MGRILYLFAAILIFTQCKKEPVVVEGEVSRILKTLSSDDMKGRKVYTDGIEKAAAFIDSELRKTGISPLPGEDDMMQSFTILEHRPGSSQVIFNGKTLSEDQFFSLSKADSIYWSDRDDYTVYDLKREKRRSQIDSLLNDDHNSLIVIDESQKEWFARAKRYYTNRSSRYRTFYSMDRNNGGSDLFILSSEPVRTITADIRYDIKEHKLSNVGGMIEGKKKDEIVIFSAHYDHIGILSPVAGDSIGNGANDNASGVTAVIQLANHFAGRSKPERTLYFLTFTAEEAGGWGSRFFAENIDTDQVVAMFNIEMIGKPAVEGPNTAWITGFELTDFGKILQESTVANNYRFYPDPYPNQNLFMRSDNFRLAQKGVPAHTISTTPIDVDQDYHEVSDEFESINIKHMTNTIRAIANAAQSIVSGDKTPQRIDPNSLVRR